MEQAGDQRRPENLAHLLAAHAGLQGFDLLAGHEVALHHVHPVGLDDVGDAAAGAIQTAATGQGSHAGTDQHNQAQTGTVTGLDGHG